MDSDTTRIGWNEQNDEIPRDSKIYKVFDKNIIAKMDKNYYTNKRERIENPAQKIF